MHMYNYICMLEICTHSKLITYIVYMYVTMQICENVHNSPIQFFNFKDYQNLLGMVDAWVIEHAM